MSVLGTSALQSGRPIHLIGVASPYAWDVVESARRLGRPVTCVDNFGGADPRLPGLIDFDVEQLAGVEWCLALASGTHRCRASRDLVRAGMTEPVALVDPTAIVASTVTIRHGAYINAGVVVASNTVVGCHANINRSASVGHDCVLGFAVSIGPGAVLTGHVEVGAGAFIGARAVVLPKVSVGPGATVGAGAVVVSNVGAGDIVVGNPARTIKHAVQDEVVPSCPHCSLN